MFRKFIQKKRNLYLLFILTLFVYYYIVLPPLHYASLDFWFLLFIISVGVFLIELVYSTGSFLAKRRVEIVIDSRQRAKEAFGKLGRPLKWMLRFWAFILAIGALAYLILSPVFFSKQYASLIQVETKTFEEDFPEIDTQKIPLIDRETAIRLGNRHLGAVSDLVSQFVISEDYTQINIQDAPYRVSPLEYADFFRYLNNFRNGIPYFMKVDMVSGDAELVKPSSPIKYTKSEYFHRNVARKLRFSHPFLIFGNPSFEVDDDNNPYYIATTYTRKFGLREPEPTGVVLLNAMTGESKHYSLDQTPQWVDRVYSAEVIMHQLDLNGRLQNGFWNSIIGKRGVITPTDGYNYLPMNDDLYLYTGMTSVSADDSNVGFMLVNMRTKETSYYPQSAAEEFSAMQSAEGSVQEKGYTATFPLLINLEGRPMYILSLKDAAGLIKEFALVDVKNYQNVLTAGSVSRLLDQYYQDRPSDLVDVDQDQSVYEELAGKVESIEAVVVDGDTVYYFVMDGTVYRANIKLNDHLPFLKDGQEVEFEANEEGEVRQIHWE